MAPGNGLVVALDKISVRGFAGDFEGGSGKSLFTSGFGDQATVIYYSTDTGPGAIEAAATITYVQFVDHENALLELWAEDPESGIATGSIGTASYAQREGSFVVVVGRCVLRDGRKGAGGCRPRLDRWSSRQH